MKNKVQQEIDRNKKEEKNHRLKMIIPCVLIASMAAPLFNIGYIISGVLAIIIGIVIYLKVYTNSINRHKMYEETIKIINDEN